jgi:hypothetical protein
MGVAAGYYNSSEIESHGPQLQLESLYEFYWKVSVALLASTLLT